MRNDKAAWIEHLWTSLRSIPAGNAAADFEAAWRRHQDRARPVAAIFGSYDAGKSSLLKRLLFEDGYVVPDEIAVSGRRETFSVDEVDGATWTYRDSPGLAGGNVDHDQKALDGLELADLLVWVLPPQLVTSNKDTFDSIATGSRFGVGPENVSAALLVVLARIDEAGIDPAENASGFSDLCERKRHEFATLLEGIGVSMPRWGVLTVSADPYQGVGNEKPDASIYAMGDGWDGVPALRAALAEAAQSADSLRLLSGYRYASRVVQTLSSAVRNERLERREAMQTCENELERLQLWSTSLEALRRKSRAELHRTVEDELLSASRTGTAAAAETLHQKLSAAIDRWGDQAYAEFEQLAASADQESGQRARSPSMERLRRLIVEMSEVEAERTRPDAGGKLKKHAGRLGPSFREAFKTYARVDIGMSTEEAAKQLRELRESGVTWTAFRKAKGKGKTFVSEEVAQKASKYVKWAEALDAFGPLVEQFGPLLIEVVSEFLSVREAEKKAERRRQLRETMGEIAAEVEAQATTGFDKMTAAFGDWLAEQVKVHKPAKAALEAQIDGLTAYEANLDALIRERPV